MNTALNPWVIRLRWPVVAAIAVVGYLAPWNTFLHLDGTGPNAHTWGMLAVTLGRLGALGVSGGFQAVLGLGIACALAAALLRTVAAARGPAEGLAGLGTWLNVAALALLMPLSGAIFALAAVAAWEWVVLQASLPKHHPAETWPDPTPRPRSLALALLAETYCWAVAGSYAIAGWSYNATLLVRCVLISAGAGLVIRGLLPHASAEPTPIPNHPTQP